MVRSSCLLIAFFFVSYFQVLSIDFSKEYLLIYFKDKGNYTLDAVSLHLSEKSFQRRIQQGLTFDSLDFPVNEEYLKILCSEDIIFKGHSKWLNAALIAVPKEQVTFYLNTIPTDIVKGIDFLGGKSILENYAIQDARITKSKIKKQYWNIKKSLGIDTLHHLQLTGKGVDIAVIDGGFKGVNTLPNFSHLFAQDQIVQALDYTGSEDGVFNGTDHGTKVLSILSALYKDELLGSAPDARFWLFKTENIFYEHPIEEFYYVKALEYCDSAGIDIVNTSLGYYDFDDVQYDYKTYQLNGQKSISTKAASIAASRGMVLVVSAGNEGDLEWKNITFPADADDILAVGVSQLDGSATSYGSVGNKTTDKARPNVAAPGHKIFAVDQYGFYSSVIGSSYAAPWVSGAVACLRQKYPQVPVADLIRMIEVCGVHYPDFNSKTGYGWPDFKKVLRLLDGIGIVDNSW